MVGITQRGCGGALRRWLLSTRLAATLIVPTTVAAAVGSWNVVSSPNPTGGGPNFLNAIAVVSEGPNDERPLRLRPQVGMTMHWNASAWTAVPNPSSNSVNLNAVSARATNDVWAVGVAAASCSHWPCTGMAARGSRLPLQARTVPRTSSTGSWDWQGTMHGRWANPVFSHSSCTGMAPGGPASVARMC